MLAIKIALKDAQKVKTDLQKKDLLSSDYIAKKEEDFIYFPVKKKFVSKYDFVEIELNKSKQKLTLKEALKDELSIEELKHLKTAFDHIGTIAILEIDEELGKKEKIIAQKLLLINKTVKTVLKKSGIHGGEFRTQDMVFLAGEKTKETVHKENNIKLKLNVENVYFSPRLSTERKRIMQLIKPDEEVLCMFSGCAPYPCVFGRNTEAKSIVGVEINPVGHKYGLKNIKLNKLKNVELINGDVNKVVPKLNKTFDRILMPLPKSAEDFLDTALKACKKGTTIHFYDFLNEKEFDLAYEKIKKACDKRKTKYKIIGLTKCGQHAPHVFRICVDFKIL